MPDKDSLPLVSVIIPTYNRSQLLRLTVESVLAQTYPAVEIIVVDDGSTDDTPAMMAPYAGRVTYIRQTNQGESVARNAGIRMASGEYLTFLDHDDLFMPTKIERQVRILESRPEIGLVHCGYCYIAEDGSLLEKVSFLPDGGLKEILSGIAIWQGGPLVRRQCLDRVGLFGEGNWCADTDMWLRIAQAGYRFACIQEPLGAYRITPGSMMVNVTKLEQGSFATLDQAYSDPRLPTDIVAGKRQAYGGMRLWMSCRYYAAGLWDGAQRNLAEALALRPQLLEHPEDLAQWLRYESLSVRVSDPVRFVTDVLDHLPPCAESLLPYRSQLQGQVYAGLALRSYGFGHIPEAKRQLAEAIALYPAMLDERDDFASLLGHHAMRVPMSDPLLYVETVFQNLPACAQPLAPLRSRVLDEVNIGYAFQDYFAGRRRRVVRRVLTALRRHPSRLLNKGLVSILVKSLPGSFTAQPAAG